MDLKQECVGSGSSIILDTGNLLRSFILTSCNHSLAVTLTAFSALNCLSADRVVHSTGVCCLLCPRQGCGLQWEWLWEYYLS